MSTVTLILIMIAAALFVFGMIMYVFRPSKTAGASKKKELPPLKDELMRIGEIEIEPQHNGGFYEAYIRYVFASCGPHDYYRGDNCFGWKHVGSFFDEHQARLAAAEESLTIRRQFLQRCKDHAGHSNVMPQLDDESMKLWEKRNEQILAGEA